MKRRRHRRRTAPPEFSAEGITRETTYERSDLYRRNGWVFCHCGPLRQILRKTIGLFMENLIAGIIAFLLFIYLLVAMLKPEKF
jgi:K+-transporting ATPase KdpF subunit